MARGSRRKTTLQQGDVLRTHPRDGYWGCAVVLGALAETREFHPKCLLAVTPWVFDHEYGFDEVDQARLEFLQEAGRPVQRIYTYKKLIGVTRIGRFDLRNVELPEVSFEPEPWRPLCGPIDQQVGSEAILAWRELHDSERLNAEIEAVEAHDRAQRAERIAIPKLLAGTRDYSPLSELPASSGELWVGLRIRAESGSEDAEAAIKVVETLTELIEGGGVGEWTGQSTGGGQVDVSFQVKNQRRVRARVVELLSREYPERDYWISDDYEMIFES